MSRNQNVEPIDPRLGKRVLCRVFLPRKVYGRIQTIELYWTGIEYWHVVTDDGMMMESPAKNFQVLEA